MPPLNKATKNECKDLGAEIHDIREDKLAVNRRLHDDAQAIWYLLAVIAGYHGANVEVDVVGPINKAHAEQLLNDLFNVNDQESKKIVAQICCKLHKQVCGHCACH